MREYIETSDYRIIYVECNLDKVKDLNEDQLVIVRKTPAKIVVIDSLGTRSVEITKSIIESIIDIYKEEITIDYGDFYG